MKDFDEKEHMDNNGWMMCTDCNRMILTSGTHLCEVKSIKEDNTIDLQEVIYKLRVENIQLQSKIAYVSKTLIALQKRHSEDYDKLQITERLLEKTKSDYLLGQFDAVPFYPEFKIYGKVLERAFRFIAGLNTQDHSVEEQREHLSVVRELKTMISKNK